MTRTVDFQDNRFHLRFPVDGDLVAEVKALPRAERDGSTWTVPMLYAQRVAALAEAHGFDISQSASQAIQVVTGEVAKGRTFRPGTTDPEPAPEPAPAPTPDRTVQVHDDGRVGFVFPFNPTLMAVIKNIPGRDWQPDHDPKMWAVPVTPITVPAVRAIADEHGFTITPEAEKRMEGVGDAGNRLEEMSHATEWDYPAPEGFNGTLDPCQPAALEYAVERKRVIIGDDMGVGKTIEALVALEAEEAFPAVVVCPSVAKYNWEAEVQKFLPHRTVRVLEGMEAGRYYDADVLVINYDILGVDKVSPGKGKRTTYKPTPGGHLEKLLELDIQGLVADESHRAKNWKAQRTRGVYMLSRDVPVRLLLTGTPLKSRPAEIISQLRILDRLDEFGGWKRFVTRFCDGYKDRWGWNLDGASNVEELNRLLRRSCYVRRTSEETQDLRPLRRSTLPVEITNRAAYNRALNDLRAHLRAEVEAEGGDVQDWVEKVEKAERAEHLVKLNALRKLVARGKMAAVKEWVEDFLESTDQKLLIFAHHKDIVSELADEFSGGLKISGDETSKRSFEIAQEFQNNPDLRVLPLNIQSGGEALTLTKATVVLTLEFSWTPTDHDQTEKRAHRRGQEHAVDHYFIVGRDTIDLDMIELLDEKRKIVTAVTDGGEAVENLNVKGALLARLMAA